MEVLHDPRFDDAPLTRPEIPLAAMRATRSRQRSPDERIDKRFDGAWHALLAGRKPSGGFSCATLRGNGVVCSDRLLIV